MQVSDTPLCDVKILSPRRFGDARGWFSELFNASTFAKHGFPTTFAQDNQSMSLHGVLRGLHYQLERPQGKLIRVLQGHIWDVAVDLRRSSPDFGKYAAFDLRPLTPEGALQLLWIPEGFAHGFLVLSPTAEVLYKTTDFYHPGDERCIRWDDPSLAIPWPLDLLQDGVPSVSDKDCKANWFTAADLPAIAADHPAIAADLPAIAGPPSV